MALNRWIASTALAASLGLAAFAPSAQAQSDSLTRAIVDIADVVFRGNQPYYRYGDYGQDDRLIAGRDAYGRTVYYRVPRDDRYSGYGYNTRQVRTSPPYGRAYGYYGRAPGQQRVKCNKHGKCVSSYYDARYDQRRYYSSNNYYSRSTRQPYWDGRRWRYDD